MNETLKKIAIQAGVIVVTVGATGFWMDHYNASKVKELLAANTQLQAKVDDLAKSASQSGTASSNDKQAALAVNQIAIAMGLKTQQLEVEIAKLKAGQPANAPIPPIQQAEESLIANLKDENGKVKDAYALAMKSGDEARASSDYYKQAYESEKAMNENLRKALEAVPKARPWSIGVLAVQQQAAKGFEYGPDFGYAFGPVRLSVGLTKNTKQIRLDFEF
jgi:hypothetical protein